MNPTKMTIGLDLGDRKSHLCALDADGEVVGRASFATTREGLDKVLQPYAPCRVALEVGTHSPWIAAALKKKGFEPIVANPRKLRAVTENVAKNDANDCELLARLARADVQLLAPVHHRREETQRDLTKVRTRAVLIEARSRLVASARSIAKTSGHRLSKCSTDSFHTRLEEVPEEIRAGLKPLFDAVGAVSAQIKQLDAELEQLAAKKYPEVKRISAPQGVGTLTALTFVLTLDDPKRFRKSRDVGPFLGLVPRQDQSGNSERQLGITKAGDPYLRKLLVQCAHVLLSDKGGESDLRAWGLALGARGGKSGKKRALLAVARKLAVLMHRLWVSEEEYVPVGYAGSKKQIA